MRRLVEFVCAHLRFVLVGVAFVIKAKTRVCWVVTEVEVEMAQDQKGEEEKKISTCWSRSNELWVMSPTRFLCAKVLSQNHATRCANTNPTQKSTPTTRTTFVLPLSGEHTLPALNWALALCRRNAHARFSPD